MHCCIAVDANQSRRSKRRYQGFSQSFQATESNNFQDDFGSEDYETVFDDSTGTKSKLNANLPFVRESEAAEETPLWKDEFESKATGLRAKDAATSNIPATPMVPIHAMKHDEYEREVFEL